MRIRERLTIAADADAVWTAAADPAWWAEWHPQIAAVEGRGADVGELRPGECFAVRYRRSEGREMTADVTVTRVEPGRAYAVAERIVHRGRESFVDRTFSVEPHGDGVRVESVVDFARAGLPWPVRVLMWLTQHVGWHEGTSPLDGLKQMVEAPPIAPSSAS